MKNILSSTLSKKKENDKAFTNDCGPHGSSPFRYKFQNKIISSKIRRSEKIRSVAEYFKNIRFPFKNDINNYFLRVSREIN